MGLVLAAIFVAVAVLAAVAYNGTPHGGPTTTCGPITFLGHTYTVTADCRYVSSGEIGVAVLFFILALIAALSARPRPR
jgi:hypothetical protein